MRTNRILSGELTMLDAVAELTVQLAAHGFRRGAAPAAEPVLLAYTPPARMNPVQRLLYSRSLHHGVATVPVKSWRELPDIPWEGVLVCHLHWVADVLRDAETAADAVGALEEFAEVMDRLRERGARLVWTAHNVLPHDAPNPAMEAELRRVLVERADAVHVMSTETETLLGEIVPLPQQRTFRAPHPSYVGAYADDVTREVARSELGVRRPDDFVVLLFGALERYKGIEELQGAFEALASESLARTPRLIVAGGASSSGLERSLRLWAASRDDVVVVPTRIPPDDVQYLYRAADLAVLPYHRGLNSGAALLALSFGVPVLASARSGLSSLVEEFQCFLYDPAAADGLLSGLRRAAGTDLEPVRRHIGEQIGTLAPHAVSDLFFTGLFSVLGTPTRGAM